MQGVPASVPIIWTALTIDSGTWWFNVRPSNTEPLLRLNVEAPDCPTMERVRDEVLGLIRGETS